MKPASSPSPLSAAAAAKGEGEEAAAPSALAGRFTLRRRLGSGSSGVVYEAMDSARDVAVALKELQKLDGASIYAFKQEFRALADVTHENLVGLHELISIDDRWFLTMELVEGVSLLNYARPSSEAAEQQVSGLRSAGQPATDPSAPTLPADEATHIQRIGAREVMACMETLAAGEAPKQPAGPAARRPRTREPAPGTLDKDRLRSVLAQLAAGVSAIHQAGRVHRDLKPSNVLVDTKGRVVILDFGLVEYLAGSHANARALAQIVGTPVYMAPEQAAGKPAGPAADWYAVGVMLYQALTGELPIDADSIVELLACKQLLDPEPPEAIDPSLPLPLCRLAVRLLARDPQKRGGADTIADALRELAPETTSLRSAGPPGQGRSGRLPFLGRTRELEAMRAALDLVRQGRPVVLHVHGTSGMGKTDLIRRFLSEISDFKAAPSSRTAGASGPPRSARGAPDDGSALVLESRCHEREWVPYKALDGAVDALAQHFATLPRAAAAKLIPRDMHALARLFPVLRGVEALAAAPQGSDSPMVPVALLPDPHEIRRRGFAALRELFVRAAADRTLVLYLDDLQWGDRDSAALLADILKPPDPPRLLLIASYRTEEAAQGEVVRSLPDPRRAELDGEREPGSALALEVRVGPLDYNEARELAKAWLGSEASDDAADRIAREAGGSPFFVQELARSLLDGHPEGELSLTDVVSARVARLPDTSRLLLEVVAVAGRPLDAAVLRQATGLRGEEEHTALSRLRAACLLRLRSARGSSEIETYHDRIREAVVQRLAAGPLKALHARIAEAMEAFESSDPEALAMHLRAAGETEKARSYMERAAVRAADALAFDRAALLYKSALELADPPSTLRLRMKLAEALANAGRGGEAGRTFLLAAEGASPEDALYGRRRAAEQFLRSGFIDEGLEAVRTVLPAVGMKLTGSHMHALASLLYCRAQLSLRGLGFEERDEPSIPKRDLDRIDVCWSIGNGLGGVDMVRGADFQARHLLLSLRAGEPYRIARALAWEAIFAAMEGRVAGQERARKLVERSTEIADRIKHPHAIAWATAAGAIASWCRYTWKDSAERCERAIALFREASSDIEWEVGSMYTWWLCPALWMRGDIDELSRVAPICLNEAEALGDLYCATSMRTYITPWLLLVADRPEASRAESGGAIQRWSSRGFHLQHWCDMFAQAQALIYEGDGARALEVVEGSYKATERSFILRSQTPRLQTHQLRARAALVLCRRSPSPRLFKLIEADTRLLEREGMPWPDAYAICLRAGVAAVRGDAGRAAELFDKAAAIYDAQDMAMHAAAARRRRGELLGGDAGRALIEAADAWMAARKIRSPERLTGLLFPA